MDSGLLKTFTNSGYGMLKQSMGAIGTEKEELLSYRPAKLHRLMESILGLLKSFKIQSLHTRMETETQMMGEGEGGGGRKTEMPGLLKRKRLREGTQQENGEYLFERKGVLQYVHTLWLYLHDSAVWDCTQLS